MIQSARPLVQRMAFLPKMDTPLIRKHRADRHRAVCRWEPSIHVQWLSGVCAPVKSVASSRPKVDTPVLLIRCRWASHARKQLSIWRDFCLQRRRASESTLMWACLRVRHHAIVCGHNQRDCPVSVFSAAGGLRHHRSRSTFWLKLLPPTSSRRSLGACGAFVGRVISTVDITGTYLTK